MKINIYQTLIDTNELRVFFSSGDTFGVCQCVCVMSVLMCLLFSSSLLLLFSSVYCDDALSQVKQLQSPSRYIYIYWAYTCTASALSGLKRI